MERWRDFSANLHFRARNSAFHRLCNPSDRPGSSAQKKKKREREKLFPLIFLRFWKAVSFPGILLASRCWLSGFYAEVPGGGAQPKVRVNLSVSQDNNNCEANIAPYMERFKAVLYILTVFWKC